MTFWRESRKTVLFVVSLAVFIDMLLYGLIIPILPELLKECGIAAHNVQLYQNVLFGSLAIGLFLSTPVFGIVSDRLQNRKMPMILGLFALTISTVFFAFTRKFKLLVIARIAQGISAAATWVVGFAMLADVYPNDDGLGFATGIALGAHTVGNLAGPLVGGFLGQYCGLKYPFLLCALLAMIDLVGRVLINPTKPTSIKTQQAIDKQLGMFDLLKDYKILLALFAVVIISSSYSSIELFIPIWLIEDWKFTSSQTSLAMLAFIIPNMISAATVGWLSDRLPRHKIITVGLIVHAIAAPLMPLSRDLTSLLCLSFLFGATAPIVSAPISPHLAAIADSYGGNTSYARVYAIFNMTWSIGMLIGPWIVGLIKVKFGFFWGMLAISIVALLFSPCFFLFGSINPIVAADKDNISLSRNSSMAQLIDESPCKEDI